MKSAKGLMPNWIVDGFVKLIMPMVRLFVKLKLSPNFFTTLGFLITTSATVVLFIDPKYIHWFGLLVLLGGICDVIDGKLARTAGRSTKFGALYDSSLDRYSEVIMFFGIAAFYVRHDSYLLSVMSFIALGGSMMVSYIRARAEGLGFTAKVGWMQRAERVVIIGFAALLNVNLFKITMFHVQNYPVTLLDIAVWVVAIFANITALQRLYFVYESDKSQTVKEES